MKLVARFRPGRWKECVHLQDVAHRYRATKAGPGYPAERSDTGCLYRDFSCDVGGQYDFAGRIMNIGVAPDLPGAVHEAFVHRVHQQRLVQAPPAIGRNGEGAPEETDAGRDLHTDPKIKRRNLRTAFGDGKPDPGLNIIIWPNGIQAPIPPPYPGSILIRGISTQTRQTFANGLLVPARQYDPSVRELRQW